MSFLYCLSSEVTVKRKGSVLTPAIGLKDSRLDSMKLPVSQITGLSFKILLHSATSSGLSRCVLLSSVSSSLMQCPPLCSRNEALALSEALSNKSFTFRSCNAALRPGIGLQKPRTSLRASLLIS